MADPESDACRDVPQALRAPLARRHAPTARGSPPRPSRSSARPTWTISSRSTSTEAEATQVVRPTSALRRANVVRERIRAKRGGRHGRVRFSAPSRVPPRRSAMSALRAQKKLPVLAPEEGRQAPTSTASIVRTFVWASQYPRRPACRSLFVCVTDAPGGLAAVQADAGTTDHRPRGVRAGFSLCRSWRSSSRATSPTTGPEHSRARLLSDAARAHAALLCRPSRSRSPGMPLSSRSRRGRQEARRRAREAPQECDEREELERAASQFEEAGGRVGSRRLDSRGVELTATRAGFVLSGRPRRRDAGLAPRVTVRRRPVPRRQSAPTCSRIPRRKELVRDFARSSRSPQRLRRRERGRGPMRHRPGPREARRAPLLARGGAVRASPGPLQARTGPTDPPETAWGRR
jgi:hypothetical protein